MLVLTAIHDVMKNEDILPTVDKQHAPYEGHNAGVKIHDHDIALAYVLDKYKDILPSYRDIEAGGQKAILFTQGRMGFNNGWLVQAEAPPGPLFETLHALIKKGGASDTDVAFYFVHWLTDLAGAVPQPWEGMLKYVCQFPDFVLRAFMDSFPYVWKLGSATPVSVYLDYLNWRWRSLELDVSASGKTDLASFGQDAVALARLCVGVQTPQNAKSVFEDWLNLDAGRRAILSRELGKTGMNDCYKWGAPTSKEGPCFLCYYGPALLVQHCGVRRAQPRWR